VEGFTWGGRGGREDALDSPPTVAAVEVEVMPGVEDVPGASPMTVGPEMEADVDDIKAGPIGVCWIMEGIVEGIVGRPPVLEPIEDADKEGTNP
jgi:hypothetical protein